MATFENAGLANQLVANVYGLVLNMRDNANGYKGQVTAGASITDQVVDGRTIPGITSTMRSDATAYLQRVKWVSDAVTANQAGVNSALQAIGLTLTEANQLKTLFNSVSNHTLAASLTTYAEINTEADYILTNIPDWQRIY